MSPTNLDPCCFICSSPYGCATNRTCDHHIEARHQQDQEDRNYNLGYNDPTGNAAVRNMMRQNRRR